MKHLLPRKIKKACNSYLDNTQMKTKWMRQVHRQIKGVYSVTMGDEYMPVYHYYTKYGAVINHMLCQLS